MTQRLLQHPLLKELLFMKVRIKAYINAQIGWDIAPACLDRSPRQPSQLDDASTGP